MYSSDWIETITTLAMRLRYRDFKTHRNKNNNYLNVWRIWKKTSRLVERAFPTIYVGIWSEFTSWILSVWASTTFLRTFRNVHHRVGLQVRRDFSRENTIIIQLRSNYDTSDLNWSTLEVSWRREHNNRLASFTRWFSHLRGKNHIFIN